MQLMKCEHNTAYFCGDFSMVGNYYCAKCDTQIDPVVYHAIKGHPHYLFAEEKAAELEEYFSKLSLVNKALLKEFEGEFIE